MCCIFTCFAWCVDAVQRVWVFAMSCCVSSAICVLLLISSVSGVALGYNYALAEYVELKETNVSVFLKRGVFDDSVVDEMDWRRGGGGPPAAERSGPTDSEGSMRKSMPGSADVAKPSPPPGRRLDDAIIMADNSRRFEGALMKLTGIAANLAATPDLNTETYETHSTSEDLAKEQMPAQKAYEDLKNAQAMLNRRILDLNPTPIHGPPTPERTTETMYGSSYEYPYQVRRMGDQITERANMERPPDEHFIDKEFVHHAMGAPPGPYGAFMKKNSFTTTYQPLYGKNMFVVSPVEVLQFHMATAFPDQPRTEPGVLYNTEKKKTTAEENTEAYEGGVTVTKLDSKLSDGEYDEDDIKGLPMRRKRELKYVTSVLRILNHDSETTDSNIYRPYGTKPNERKEHTLLPKGSLFESKIITTPFRKLASQIS